ncbi:hypothetical protein [Pseudomonas aeruginosa]|uniref:hypothetical protein n=1 Tax=Pseudomonas aeruginosa TaxID=287 RepID=UPI0032E3A935
MSRPQFQLGSLNVNQKATDVLAYANFLRRNADGSEAFLDVILNLRELQENRASDNHYESNDYYYDGTNDYAMRDLIRKISTSLFEIEAREANFYDSVRPYSSENNAKILFDLPVTTGNLVYRAVTNDRTDFYDTNFKAISSIITLVEDNAVSPTVCYRHTQPVQVDEKFASVRVFNEETGAEATLILTMKSAKLLAGH